MRELEELNSYNREKLLEIERDDVPSDFVEDVSETILQADYGTEHRLRGHCYAVREDGEYAGILLIGEGIPWECDPPELCGVFFFRILGFIIDKKYRSCGLGSWALEEAIFRVCSEYGRAPIVIECHKDNVRAAEFYKRHGFRPTDHRENDDFYYIRPSTEGIK